MEDVETTEKKESNLPCVVPCLAFCNFFIPFRILSSLKEIHWFINKEVAEVKSTLQKYIYSNIHMNNEPLMSLQILQRP